VGVRRVTGGAAANRRAAPHSPRLGLVVAALIVLVGCLMLVAGVVYAATGVTSSAGEIAFSIASAMLVINLGLVGGIVSVRRPGHGVGRILLVAGTAAAVEFGGASYATTDWLLGGARLPLVVPIAWLSTVVSTPTVVLLVVFLPMLFPSGRLPGPRWRILAFVAVAAALTGAVSAATRPGPIPIWRVTIDNPVVVPAWARAQIEGLESLSNLSGPPAFLIVIGGLVRRFLASEGAERRQLKWFLSVASIAALALGTSILSNGQPISDLAWQVAMGAMACLPLAIGIAVLRYRLYDIDRIVSRAIGYSLVTALLGSVFAVIVLLFETALAPLTGSSAIAIAASTLVVAALFQPARRVVQRAVDQRFDRGRVDADRAADAFAGQLRTHLDLESIRTDAIGTVSATLRPESAAIWIRRAENG
jgi:hypothetical protein